MRKVLFGALVACSTVLTACEAPREPIHLGSDLGAEVGEPRSNPGGVRGIVRSPGGGFVPGVRISLDDGEATTDSRGFFEFVGVPPGELVVRAEREGWSTTQRQVAVQADQVTSLDITLLFMGQGQLDPPVAGPDSIVLVDGVRIEFISGTFKTEDGEVVQGLIEAAVVLVNEPGTMHAAPGEMVAVDQDGETFPLESFGMVEVLLSSGGAPVVFAGNAQLSFPLVQNHGFADGDTIPLWSFDEASNFWIAEGEGTVDGSLFVAEVGHFTWWNADKPLTDTSCVEGILSLPTGGPGSGFVVNATGIDHLGASSATTGPDGSFCIPLKPGGVVELTAGGSDGSSIWTWSFLHESSGSPASCAEATCSDIGLHVFDDLTSDEDGDGVTELAGDCDDDDPSVSPLASDLLTDGLDEDCDGIDGLDLDGDGAPGWNGGGTDCNDSDPEIGPTRPELCNELDDDCDGVVDGLSPLDGAPVFADVDGDGAGDPLELLLACNPPEGYVENGDDCDDADPFVAPHADELCNHPTLGGGIDEDCDGSADEEDAVDGLFFWADLDSDGYGATGAVITACTQPVMSSPLDGDCDDESPSVYPQAMEVCNGVDDDCDLVIDESGAVGEVSFFVDADGDGYGVSNSSVLACLVQVGTAVLDGDCDDGDAAINPGATESCSDTSDLNCDGSTQFADQDGDGSPACTDCDDNDPSVGPSASELCDAIDSDCDGSLVDFFINTDGDGLPDCIDNDDDGDGDPDGSDCAPLDGSIFIGATELCDSIDSDCDGSLVDSFSNLDQDSEPDCVDLDDDGDGSPDSIDCAPLLATVYPGAPELCDGIDNDCDGAADNCAGSSAGAVLYGVVSGGQMGSALAVGDLNADGSPDVIAGAPGGAGAVHLYAGPLTGSIPGSATLAQLTGEAAGDGAGASIASSCDLNGDGLDDLAVGAWGHDQGGLTAGAVYVMFGPLSGLTSLSAADAVYYGESSGDWAGWSVACAGDTNGDGTDGLLVGAWREDEGSLDAGAVYLIEGSITPGTSTSLSNAEAKLLGEAAFDYAGHSVAGVGDLDGDGNDDVLIGAWGRDESGTQAGVAYLVHGPIGGTLSLSQANAKLLGATVGERAGAHVSRAGDVNGDGAEDLLIGAWAYPGDNTDVGAAYVVHGPVTGTVSLLSADRVYTGLSAGDRLGMSGSSVGDVNGDGFDDVLIGAPRLDAGQIDSGAAYLLLGSIAGLPADLTGAVAVLAGEQAGDQSATAVLGVGDMDGDGSDDMLIGAPFADGVSSAGGAVYLQFSSSVLSP